MTYEREADARREAEEFRTSAQQTKTPPQYRDAFTGEKIADPNDIVLLQDPVTKRRTTFHAPRLTAEEEKQAAEALRGALEAGQVKYPLMANAMLADPSKLWLLGEIQMMLSAKPNPVSYDFTADLMEGLTTTTAQRNHYEVATMDRPTQQMFWEEIGKKYGPAERNYLIDSMAQLSARGADRVAALSLAWTDTHGLDQNDDDQMAQLFLNISTWSTQEQGYDLGQEGFFGALDAAQEFVERNVLSPLVNAGVGLISGPEEAARRRDLTLGQQIAYEFGIKPPEKAGDFGWWAFTTGAVDALAEIGGDPIAWVAGVGAGVRAARTIPVAVNATRAGRTTAALRSLLPKPFSGVSRRVYGGRFARVTYSLGAKSIDDLLRQTIKSGVADDALNLLKQGNISRFQRLYPAWRALDDDAIRTIQEAVETPEEFIEVLKSAALDEVRRSGRTLAELERNAKLSETAMRTAAGVPSPSLGPDIVDEILKNPDDFVFHGTRQIGDDTADVIMRGEDTFNRGGLTSVRQRAEDYTADVRPSGAENIVDPKGRKVLVFRKADLPQEVQRGLAKGDGELEEYAGAWKNPENVKGATPVHIYNTDEGLEGTKEGVGAARTFDELLMNQNIPQDIRLQAAKDRLSLNSWNMTPNRILILSEIPQRTKRVFSWQKVLDIQGVGRVTTGVRRTAARITPGRIPSQIDLFNTRQGVDDLRRLGEHFGLQQHTIDNLVLEFQGLELGARQDWVWDTFLRRIGRETRVPAFENELIQFYKGAGVRNFSASGVDLLPNGQRIPMLPTQMNNMMPIPVEVLTQVFARSRNISSRSKLARAMGFNGRGLGSTASRRSQLVQRLRRDLGDQAEGLSDDQLYDMAYSLVSPNSGLDGRGMWAGKMLPKLGSWGNHLHQWFTKSMLVFRPIQWMWRVALLEEPIRAHMFNLPSLYTNPLQYMARAREAHYIWNVRKWAELNSAWGQEVLHTLTRGGRQQVLDRVDSLGLTDEIFGATLARRGFQASGGDTTGTVVEAPIKFVKNAASPRGLEQAETGAFTEARIERLGDKVSKEAFRADIAERGIQEPIEMAITPNGVLVVSDGHHRLAAALEAGHKTVPVQLVAWGDTAIEVKGTRGINVANKLKVGLDDLNPAKAGFKNAEGLTTFGPGAVNRRWDDIFTDIPWPGKRRKLTTQEIHRTIDQYVNNAIYGRTRVNKLSPIKRVPWAVKNRAHSIATAEKALVKLNLPQNFDFADEASEIAGRLVSGYLGEAVGASDRKLYQWQAGLTNDEAFTHGRVWGAKLVEFVEDSFGRAALRRRAAILRGEQPDVTGHDLVNSSRWGFIAPDLRLKYPQAGNDIEVAEAYMDDMLAQEIDHLFRPFIDEMGAPTTAPKAPAAPPETLVITLPPRFYDDHVARDLPAGIVHRRNSKGVTVELTRDEYDDMLHDAQLYLTTEGPGSEMRGLVTSARATEKKLLAGKFNTPTAPAGPNTVHNPIADLYDEFATSRRIEGTIAGVDLDWDLRSANYAGGVRQVGDFTASVRRDAGINIPTNLPAPSLDGRFLAEDDPGFPSRISNWVLQTFGENATQTINRRPAWVHTYKRWYDNYTNLDVPPAAAERLAIDHANKMVNHVFFNMDEAPYYVARLNRILPFFGATYEVMGAWSYKMPVAVGGSWPGGAGEFARKFDRLIDGFVNIGLLDREEEEDGSISLTLNLVPPTSDVKSDNELGAALQGAGFKAVNTLDSTISTLLGLEEGLGLRSQGYRLAAGHPLNPSDYGILSFAQADIGLNPATNIVVSALAGRIPGATGPTRQPAAAGESVADLAERLNVEYDTLVRYNREIFVDLEGFGSTELYNGLLAGTVDPEDTVLPSNSSINVPGSSLWDAISDTFMPFGEISSPHEFGASFIPSAFRWVLAGLALQNQPSDEFWKDSDLEGAFGGILPPVNEAQAASQLNEAFMYLEAHDLVNGKGPFERIQEKEQRLAQLLESGQADQANELRAEIKLDTEAFLGRAQKVAAESLILRGMTGQMLPTTPGHVRLEQEKIQEYWNTSEYADSIVAGEGETRLKAFKSMEEFDQYQEQLAAWLTDPTGDRARAIFRENNPQLMAYLTPKTFYTNPIPENESYEEYQRQIESGERKTSPLHVTMWRARSATIQADYYNKFIALFGNDPVEAASVALHSRQTFGELQDERDLAYQGLEMWDDMHGGVYNTWREENYQDVETWAQDQINDNLNRVRDNLQILFELEDNLDVEIDLEGVANLNSSIRGAIAEISNAIDQYNELSDRTITRNPYEESIHRYFQEIYIPYSDQIAQLYDQIPEAADSERVSLIYEQIKFLKNDLAGTEAFIANSDVPFPNPLEYSWQGKDKEEQIIKMQQWISRPVEWMDMDQAHRIMANSPQLESYVPTDEAEFEIYRTFTLRKIEVDEAFEANEITRSQRTKAMKFLEENLHRGLVEQGRGNEIKMMEMTPYEKLEFSGLLPTELEYLGDHVRYYKQVLEQTEETPGTVNGRIITAPLYDMVEQALFTDPHLKNVLQDLALNLRDETTMDTFLPYLFFSYTGER